MSDAGGCSILSGRPTGHATKSASSWGSRPHLMGLSRCANRDSLSSKPSMAPPVPMDSRARASQSDFRAPRGEQVEEISVSIAPQRQKRQLARRPAVRHEFEI